MQKKFYYTILFTFIAVVYSACLIDTENVKLSNGNLTIEFNNLLHSKLSSNYAENNRNLTEFSASEFITVENKEIKDFIFLEKIESEFTDKIGKGKITIIKGLYKNDTISVEKIVEIKSYENFPDIFFLKVKFINKSSDSLLVQNWVNGNYILNKKPNDDVFWSFQGSSSSKRDDWIKPLEKDFYQENYMGMNNSDYGGGIPVLDVWSSDVGIAIGHTELVPKLNYLPVRTDKTGNKAIIAQEFKCNEQLAPGDTLSTFETFVAAHTGDCYNPLSEYSKFMQAKGIKFSEPNDESFESIWCSWGYERNVTPAEILNTLNKVKELGIKWVVIDDGYQVAEGDWNLNPKKYPKGNIEMKNLVDKIHSLGLKAKIWWTPLAADPETDFVKNHRDAIITNEEDVPRYITWWDAYYMSPADSATLYKTIEDIKLFVDYWGFDGFKMDGQHLNAVPPNYNWKQKGTKPIDAVEKLPEFYKLIQNQTVGKDTDFVLELCPCGTCMSFYNMPYVNQTVSSDPTSSRQIRIKGKVYKALMPNIAYYGDHVELSDNGNDFASSFGVGAVLGTKFTYPKNNPTVTADYLLTPEKEIIWKKWFGLYNKMMLSKEKYLGNLYDIGFDKPETHVIQKADTMYYAFYADEWNGKIELRGLKEGKYKVVDYVNNLELGTITFSEPFIEVKFNNYLLVEVYPVK